ncbi:MAG: ROK family protein [Thermodesulfobacteriota bacterium]
MQAWVGIDLGGTNTRLALVHAGRVEAYLRFATEPRLGPADLVRRLAEALAELGQAAQGLGLSLAGVGVASPGVLDRASGVILASPNLPAMAGFALGKALAQASGLRVALENDANLYALGEHRFGAGQGQADLICFTLGTGVGGGLILEGRLVVGALGCGGEVGHLIVEPDGRPCGCGARGCLEAYASATGLTAALAEALAAGEPTRLGPNDGVKAMDQAAQAGDSLAVAIFAQAGRALGRALAAVVALTGLDLAIFGGGVAKGWPLLEAACRAELAARLRMVDPGRVRLLPARLGDEAPLLGAAAFAQDSLLT